MLHFPQNLAAHFKAALLLGWGVVLLILLGCEDLSPGVEPPTARNDADRQTAQTDVEPQDGEKSIGVDNANLDSVDDVGVIDPSRDPTQPLGAPYDKTGQAYRDDQVRRSEAQNGAPGSAGRVQLRTGVALAQTLPTGTGMLFSVSYEFVSAAPDSTRKYYLVIRGKDGTMRQEVQVQQSGTLQSVALGVRPENGPFSCFLLEVSRYGERQLCPPYDLQ